MTALNVFSGTTIDQNLFYTNVGGITSKPTYTETTNPNVPTADTSGNVYQFVLGNYSATPSNDVLPGNAFIGGSVVINPETIRDVSGNRVTSDISLVSGNINITGYTPTDASGNALVSSTKTGNVALAKSTAKLAVGGSTLTTADTILLDASGKIVSINDATSSGISINGATTAMRLGPSATQIVANGASGNVTLANYSAVTNAAGQLSTFLNPVDASGNTFNFYSSNFVTQGLTATSAAPRNYVDTVADDLYRNIVGTTPSTLAILQQIDDLLNSDTSGIAALNAALNGLYSKSGGLISGNVQILDNFDVSGISTFHNTTSFLDGATFNTLASTTANFGNTNQTTIDISGNIVATSLTTGALNITHELQVGTITLNADGSGTIISNTVDTSIFTATGLATFGNAGQATIDVSGNLNTSGQLYSSGLHVVDASGIAIMDVTTGTGPGEHVSINYLLSAYQGLNVANGASIQSGNFTVTSLSGNNVTLNPPTIINNSLSVSNGLNLSGSANLNNGVVVNGGDVSLLGNTSNSKVYVGLTNAMSIPTEYQLTTPDTSSQIVANGMRFIPDGSGNSQIVFGTNWKFLMTNDTSLSGTPTNATLKIQYSPNNNLNWNTVAQFIYSQ